MRTLPAGQIALTLDQEAGASAALKNAHVRLLFGVTFSGFDTTTTTTTTATVRMAAVPTSCTSPLIAAPVEVVLNIISHCGSITDILALVRTCHHMSIIWTVNALVILPSRRRLADALNIVRLAEQMMAPSSKPGRSPLQQLKAAVKLARVVRDTLLLARGMQQVRRPALLRIRTKQQRKGLPDTVSQTLDLVLTEDDIYHLLNAGAKVDSCCENRYRCGEIEFDENGQPYIHEAWPFEINNYVVADLLRHLLRVRQARLHSQPLCDSVVDRGHHLLRSLLGKPYKDDTPTAPYLEVLKGIPYWEYLKDLGMDVPSPLAGMH